MTSVSIAHTRRRGPTNRPKRAVIYARLSVSDPTKKFTSIAAQIDSGRARIRSEGWEHAGTFVDDGRSGATFEGRSGFARMMELVVAGEVDVIIIVRLDRISRNTSDLLSLVARLEALGVGLVSITEQISTHGPFGKFMLTLLGALAELERGQVIERVRAKIEAAKRRGKFVGGPVPLGYDLVDGTLAQNALEAVAVRTIFDLYVQCGSLRETARQLNARGYQPKARGKVTHGFTLDMVERVLKNVAYVGKTALGGELFHAEHEAIVDTGLFERVNAILKTPARDERAPNATYVLSGALRCVCGGAWTGASTKKAKREYRYYRCATRDKDRGRCGSRAIPAEELESFVASEIARAGASPAFARRVSVEMRALAGAERCDLERERRGLRAACEVAPVRGARVRDDLRAAYARRLAAIDARLAALGGAEGAVASQRHLAKRFETLWREMTDAHRKQLVKALIEEIVVDTRGNSITLRFVDPATPRRGAAA